MNSNFSFLGSLAAASMGGVLLQGDVLRPLLLGLAAIFAGTPTPEVDSHKPQPAFEGTVISVGKESLALQEKTTNSTMAFLVAPYAAIEKDSSQATLGAIHAGDVAKVTTDTDGRQYKAIRIVAESPPPKK